MSLTIEFYSADPQELIDLFAEDVKAPLDEADEKWFFEKQQTFLRADFPSRLLLPDDLDALCQLIHAHHPSVPPRFENICLRRVWDDGEGTEMLVILSPTFVYTVAGYSDQDITELALGWAAIFPSNDPLPSTPAFQAVFQLRDVARDATIYKKSLLYHLAGVPQFFEYLRAK